MRRLHSANLSKTLTILAVAAVALTATASAAASADAADASTGHIESVEFLWDNGAEERAVTLEPAFDPEIYSYTLEMPRATMGKLRVDSPELYFMIYDYPIDQPMPNGIRFFPRGIYQNSIYETAILITAPGTWTLITVPSEINGQTSDAVQRTYTFNITKKLGKITSAPGDVEVTCVQHQHAPPVGHPDRSLGMVWHVSRVLTVKWTAPFDGGAFSNVIIKIKPEGGKAVKKRYSGGFLNETTLEDFQVDTDYKGWIRGKNRDSAGPWAKFSFNCPDVPLKRIDYRSS